MSGTIEAGSTSRPAFVAWLLAAGAVVCLVALVNGALLLWSAGSREPGPVPLAGGSVPHLVGAAPGPDAGSDVMEPGRTPIPVLIKRSHADDGCARVGRVPIAVVIECHQRDRAAALAEEDVGSQTDQP
jgi:hypothetical protein